VGGCEKGLPICPRNAREGKKTDLLVALLVSDQHLGLQVVEAIPIDELQRNVLEAKKGEFVHLEWSLRDISRAGSYGSYEDHGQCFGHGDVPVDGPIPESVGEESRREFPNQEGSDEMLIASHILGQLAGMEEIIEGTGDA